MRSSYRPLAGDTAAVRCGLRYLRARAELFRAVTYQGRGLDHRPVFADRSPSGVWTLTRRAVRRAVGPQLWDAEVGRLVGELAALADRCDAKSAGRPVSEVEAVWIGTVVDAGCDAEDAVMAAEATR